MGLRVPVANGEPHRPASFSKKLKADWVGREAGRKMNNSEDLLVLIVLTKKEFL